MSSNFTVPDFNGDDYEDDAPVTLAKASPDVIVSGWPECEIGSAVSAVVADSRIPAMLQCADCQAVIHGRPDAKKCPLCRGNRLSEYQKTLPSEFRPPGRDSLCPYGAAFVSTISAAPSGFPERAGSESK